MSYISAHAALRSRGADYIPAHISVTEAMARHNISRSHLYVLLGTGKVIAVKNGRRTLIDLASLDAHFANLPAAQIKAPANVQMAVAD